MVSFNMIHATVLHIPVQTKMKYYLFWYLDLLSIIDNASEIVENILYITADDAKEQVQAPVDTPVDTTQNGSDVYAVVEKKPKTDDRDDQPVYRDVCKADQKKSIIYKHISINISYIIKQR